MKSLKDKVILITGAGIGIGRETAFKFAEERCNIIITYYKDKAEAMKVFRKCLILGASDALALELDVMNGKSIAKCVKKITERFGRIDILINNAGTIVLEPFKEQTYEEIENQLRTNLEGLIKMTKECLPYIKEDIINIASGAGQEGYADLSVYCTTKFGVRGFTQSLAKELRNLNVYVVNPGTTATRMTNFRGIGPEKVADIILNAAKGKYKAGPSRDINVWELA